VDAPPVILPRSRPLRWWPAGIAAGLVGAAVLFWFDPARHGFYPRCLFHATTGLLCPGCGGLRGLHEFFHGHWLTALRMNALVFGVLPLALAGALWRHWREGNGIRLEGFRLSAQAGWWLLGVLFAFGVLRNVPVFPFTLLAP
jgi:hypothetical protein